MWHGHNWRYILFLDTPTYPLPISIGSIIYFCFFRGEKILHVSVVFSPSESSLDSNRSANRFPSGARATGGKAPPRGCFLAFLEVWDALVVKQHDIGIWSFTAPVQPRESRWHRRCRFFKSIGQTLLTLDQTSWDINSHQRDMNETNGHLSLSYIIILYI